MKIKVFGDLNHHVYGWMRKKAEYGFQQLNHQIVDNDPEIILTFGSNNHWDEIKDLSCKKIFSCHGVDWAKGFDTENNRKVKSMLDNCDIIVYQSEFAKYMAQKAFDSPEGSIILNAGIPDFPKKFQTWEKDKVINIATCGIFRAWKNLHQLERMVRLLASQEQEVKLFVIGREHSETTLYGLPFKGKNYEIEYLGFKSHEQIKEIYSKCHIYITLSFNDFSPATTGEAMCWGLPIICTNSGGSKDVIRDAGIILDTDPFIDYPFNINREDILPKVDDQKFLDGFWQLMNNLEEYQQKNKEQVLKESNIITQVQKFLDLT